MCVYRQDPIPWCRCRWLIIIQTTSVQCSNSNLHAHFNVFSGTLAWYSLLNVYSFNTNIAFQICAFSLPARSHYFFRRALLNYSSLCHGRWDPHGHSQTPHRSDDVTNPCLELISQSSCAFKNKHRKWLQIFQNRAKWMLCLFGGKLLRLDSISVVTAFTQREITIPLFV